MNIYNINNAVGGAPQITDSNGIVHAVSSSATLSLTDAQYQSAVKIFGAANVIKASDSPDAIAAVAIETNPSSTLTSGSATSLSSSNNFVASSNVAANVVAPSLLITSVPGGSALLRRFRLSTNASSGWGGAVVTINFWLNAPTYSNGDGAPYAVATGGAGYLGSVSITLNQFGDAASGVGAPTIGNDIGINLVSGQQIYWDMQVAATLTKASGQQFTLVAETLDNQ